MPIPGRLDGCLPPGREGAPTRGPKHKARFIFEDEMGLLLVRFFLDPLDVVIAPRIDLFFVALSGSMMNLLIGPA